MTCLLVDMVIVALAYAQGNSATPGISPRFQMNLTEFSAKLFLVKKLLASLLILIVAAPTAALAMGSGNNFSDAQTGLTYTVYKPGSTLGLKVTKFSLLPCQPGKEEWLHIKYGGTTRYLEIMQTMAKVKCSDPGVSKYLRTAKINSMSAKVYVYCDPTKADSYKKCGVNDIARVGGYLIFTTKATKGLKGTEIQVQGTGGITYSQILTVAKSLKTVTASGNTLSQALPPVMIDPTTTTEVSVKLGNSIVLTVSDPSKWSVQVAIPGIVEFVPGGDQGGYTTNPSIKSLTSGATTVKLVNSDDATNIYQLEITVTP